MGTKLVRDALWTICDLLNDTSPQFKRWPERTLVSHYNDAQLAVFKYLPLCGARIDTVRLQTGALQSIDIIAPADCRQADGTAPSQPLRGMQFLRPLVNMGDDGQTVGRTVTVKPADAMDALDPRWQTKSGTEVREVFFDPQTPKFFLVNPPLASRKWLRLSHVVQPPQIPAGGEPGSEVYRVDGGSSQAITIDDEHADLNLHYVLARCFMRNSQNAGDVDKASLHTTTWIGLMNSKVAAVTGNNPNIKRLPFAPQPVGQAS